MSQIVIFKWRRESKDGRRRRMRWTRAGVQAQHRGGGA
ncbi:hypothetical protein B1M_44165 [Burkholderia sp. TJI49]|nr:hypothetical protein B1M_44165 [Burkholderia sp. TJI49]